MLKLWLAGLRAPGARALPGLLAIALGVALAYTVHLLHAAGLQALESAALRLAGVADLTVQAPRQGMSEALYPWLAQLPQVQAASPVVLGEVGVAGSPALLRLVGVDVFAAARVQPALLPVAGHRLDLLDPACLFPDAAARARLPSDRPLLRTAAGPRPMRVCGQVPGRGDPPLAVTDIAVAQDLLGAGGHVSRVDLLLAPGVDRAGFAARLRTQLPAGVAVLSPLQAAAREAAPSRSYRVNLQVLALVALFSGALLVYSSQALAVTVRLPQLALLRMLGLPRRTLLCLLVAEGAALGLAGGAAGCVAGHALAGWLLGHFGAGLGSGHLGGEGALPGLAAGPVLVFLAGGMAAGALGTLVPALRAAREAPARALHGVVQAQDGAARPHPAALGALALGLLLLGAPPVNGIPLPAYAAIALLLLGVIGLVPALLALILAGLPLPQPVPVRLALQQLRAAPRAATLGLAALVASVALAVSMGVMVASFRHSLEDWLQVVLPADLYLRAGQGADGLELDPAAQARVRATPGVARVQFQRQVQLLLGPAQLPVSLIARDGVAGTAPDALPLVSAYFAPRAGEEPVYLSEQVADLTGWRAGDPVRLPLPLAGTAFRVAGVWRDYARVSGAVLVDRARYVALSGDERAGEARLWVVPGVAPAELGRRLRAVLGGSDDLDLVEPADLRALSLSIFERTFAATHALEAAAVLVGVAGLASGTAARVLSRRREFGMLRHLGLARRDLLLLVCTEALVVALTGLVAGTVAGLGLSLVLVDKVTRESFHWSLDLHVPGGSLLLYLATLLVACIGSALLAGRAAVATGTLHSVRED